MSRKTHRDREEMSTFFAFQKYNKEVTDWMEVRGFGGKVFWNSPRAIYQGPDCEWPSEKEVFARRYAFVIHNGNHLFFQRTEESRAG